MIIDRNGYIEVAKNNKGLDLANNLLKMLEDRKEGNFI